jgi:hypothetical protein
MKLGIAFFIFNILIGSGVIASAQAENSLFQRKVDLEWEAIEKAVTYDLEIKNALPESKTFEYQTTEPKWTGRLIPGTYTMRLRSRDRRQVPGPWSPPEQFKVDLEMVELEKPKANQVFNSEDIDNTKITFAWKKNLGAKNYRFELRDDRNEKIHEAIVDVNELKLSIPVARKYKWKVTALTASGIEGLSPETQREFTVWGGALETPRIVDLTSEFVREIKWSKPPHVDHYEVQIVRYEENKDRFFTMRTYDNYTDNQLVFDQDWLGGLYRVKVRAVAPLRANSDLAVLQFTAAWGDRSPASEFRSTIRQSIERVENWYAMASYLVSQLQYYVEDRTISKQLATKHFGGNGRLGLGYLDSEHPWGFLGIIDVGGFDYKSKNYTYSSFEVQGMKRYDVGDRGEFRASFGMFHKELPQITADPTVSTDYYTLKSEGPLAGVEYWHSVTEKLGLQLNFKSFLGVNGRAPGGETMVPSFSVQYGILGSYKLDKGVTGLMGWAYRIDQIKYKPKYADPDVASSGSLANPGDVNMVEISGHYLNLLLEYDF